ncbi:MAG: Rieske 2Fe-2S domain-containing protein [Catalinimonas sp.]
MPTRWYFLFPSLDAAARAVPPGTMRRLDAAGRKVCLVHHAHGFFALDDACPHLGASLSEGHLNADGEVICPWHSYRYDLRHGAECRQRSEPARLHRLERRDDGLYLGIEGLELV